MLKRFTIAALVAAAAVVCPAHATVTSTTSYVQYACNGVTTDYTVTFPYTSQTDLVVTKTLAAVTTTLVLTTNYTVTPSGGSSTTGTVKLVSGATCANTYTLTITRTVPLTQPTSLRTAGGHLPENTELAIDRLEMQIQQTDARITTGGGSGGTVTNVDAPLLGDGSSGSHLRMGAGSSGANGYLTSTDWSTFNGKGATIACATHKFVSIVGSSSSTCAQPVVADILDFPTSVVQLQGSSPGSAQTGNVNLSGKVIVALSSAGNAITATGGTSSGSAVSATGGTPNGYAVIGTGTGSGAGVGGIGGSSNGPGGSFSGGGTNGVGLTSQGAQNTNGVGGVGGVFFAGTSGGDGVNGASVILLSGGATSGSNATTGGTPGGTGGDPIRGATAGLGGNGNGAGAGGAGGNVISGALIGSAVRGGDGGPGGSTGAGGAGGKILLGTAGFGGTGGGVSGNGGAGGEAINVTGGLGGSPGTAAGTAGVGGAAITGTGGAGGTTTGAGTGGNGGAGGTFVGGAGGATSGGTGGTGGAGGSAIGGNGASNNGAGATGWTATGGNGAGTGANGNGATLSNGSGGTGTATGYPVRLVNNNTIKATIGQTALAADPSSLSDGDEWIAGATTAMTPKARLNGVTQPILTYGANGSRAVQTLRVAGCTTAASAGATCSTNVTWTVAWPDANYTVTCTGETATNIPVLGGGSGTVKSAATFQVFTVAITAAAASFGTIDCISIHD